MMTHTPGTHALLDLYDCDAALLADASALQALLQHAADMAGATTLAAHFTISVRAWVLSACCCCSPSRTSAFTPFTPGRSIAL